MQFWKNNVKLKLVKGFKMPEQEYVKSSDPSIKGGTFRKTGGEVQMYTLIFVEQDEFKTAIEFNTKEDSWNKFEDSNELLAIAIDLINDPFTGKLKTAKLSAVKVDPDQD